MINTAYKKETLEILLSTMDRNSLSFLNNMFPKGNYLNYNILIINQTTEKNLLKSEYENIRIINSFERGLSQSRNLALENSKGDICLLADDDVKYTDDFKDVILEVFQNCIDSDIITFQMIDNHGELFKQYSNNVAHNKNTIKTVNSVVIALRRQTVISSSVLFNTNFGLGSTFQTADEYVFLRDALNFNLKISFEPKVILSHDLYSSGKDSGSDRLIYARSALYYKYSGILAYLRLCKYLFKIYQLKYIKFSEIQYKLNVGFKGIKEYKRLLVLGKENN